MEKFTLHQILEAFCAPINEEQAWAVCYQCARYLQSSSSLEILSTIEDLNAISSPKLSKNGESRQNNNAFSLSGVILSSDGNVVVYVTKTNFKSQEKLIVKSLGILVFQALDYGLDNTEEQKLSPALENLIGRMTGEGEVPQDGDEGIFDDDKCDMSLDDVVQECIKHIGSDIDVGGHCKAVCRALAHEAGELVMFLERVVSENVKIKVLCGQSGVTDESQLPTLQRRDWARLWMQVMKELRQGVKLKKVQQSTVTHPVEYELTPYEIMMDDVRCKRYILNKVPKCKDSYPIRVKKDVHEIILEFIRSRPPLQPANKRILSAPAEKYIEPREQLLMDIRTFKPKLRPTPGRLLDSSRSVSIGNQVKKVIKPDLSLLSFGSSDNDTDPANYCHDNDDDKNKVSVLDLAPLTPLSPKSPPKHLPWQHTEFDQIDQIKRNPQIETTTTTATSSSSSSSMFFPSSSSSSSSSSKHLSNRNVPPHDTRTQNPTIQSFVAADFRDFNMASTVECLSLTVEEVMHIRGVLTKAELECASVDPELHSLLGSGKVCFTCKKVKFSIFGPWPTKCKFCCRNVCSQCSSKMRIPTEHFEHIPVYTLNPSPSSPLNSMDMHCVDGSLTGSAPSSPERELPLPPLPDRFSSKEINEKKDKFQKTFSLDKCRKPPPVQSQRPVIGADGVANTTRNIFQRSQTIRPFSAAASTSSASIKSRILDSGPLMNVCSDCRAMVVGIIRASRRCLALLGHRGAYGRAERAYSACPSSRRSWNNSLADGTAATSRQPLKE